MNGAQGIAGLVNRQLRQVAGAGPQICRAQQAQAEGREFVTRTRVQYSRAAVIAPHTLPPTSPCRDNLALPC